MAPTTGRSFLGGLRLDKFKGVLSTDLRVYSLWIMVCVLVLP